MRLGGVPNFISRGPGNRRRSRLLLDTLRVHRKVPGERGQPDVPAHRLLVAQDQLLIRGLVNSNVHTGASVMVGVPISLPFSLRAPALQYVISRSMSLALPHADAGPDIIEQSPEFHPQISIWSARGSAPSFAPCNPVDNMLAINANGEGRKRVV